MNIVYKPVNELIEYENNPRDNSAAVAKVAESIEKFGFINPIAITPDNVIISGHVRLKAAELLKIEQVPCIIHEMGDEETRLARIIDNKSNEYSTWDSLKLQAELDTLPNIGLTLFDSGYTDLKKRCENLTFKFGNTETPITEAEYEELKSAFDNYVEENTSYLGFINYLVRGVSDV